MFEVSFTAKQRKNYLFYCLLYLFHTNDWSISEYLEFVSGLADKYFKDVYLLRDKLNEINTPKPGSFDETILNHNKLDSTTQNCNFDFAAIYGDGKQWSKGIPLFVFNYLDYKLWEKYAENLRGKNIEKENELRIIFLKCLAVAILD